jgi:hypothetical protein
MLIRNLVLHPRKTRGRILVLYIQIAPIPVAEWSKARICGLSLAGIAGSNPTGGTNVCFFCVVCCQVEVSATGRYLVQWSPTDCDVSLCVIFKPQECGGPDSRWDVAPGGKKILTVMNLDGRPKDQGPETCTRLKIFLYWKNNRNTIYFLYNAWRDLSPLHFRCCGII